MAVIGQPEKVWEIVPQEEPVRPLELPEDEPQAEPVEIPGEEEPAYVRRWDDARWVG